MNEQARTSSENPTFRPAKPIGWVIRGAQHLNRVDLAWRNRLGLEERALELLRASVAGLESSSPPTAPTRRIKVCLELSRRCRRRFLYGALHQPVTTRDQQGSDDQGVDRNTDDEREAELSEGAQRAEQE